VSENHGQRGELARLHERIERLEAVAEASAMVNSTLELDRLAEHIISIATRLIGAERGSLFLVDGASGSLRSLVAQGIDGDRLELAVGEGIVGTVAATGEAEILNRPYDDRRFDPSVDRATGYTTHSLLTVPVRDRERRLIAVLQLLNHRRGAFSADDVGFLSELGVQFAVALASARMHRDALEAERLAEEMRMAAEIQQRLRPRDPEGLPGLELETLVRPCHEVGGDYWDVIPRPGGRWWLVVADISGKGASAGLIAANVQAYLWSRRGDRRSLAKVVAEGNDLLHRLTDGIKYATVVVAEWKPSTGMLAWVSAGHPPLVLRRGGRTSLRHATGPPMGLIADQHYGTGRARLAAGDMVLMYTDGVLEAGIESEAGEFGVDRIRPVLRSADSPAEAVARLADAVGRHLGDAEPNDDLTVVCARCTGVG
jgi:serine phosphatase RsbU (regulator of sigma subunit)